MNKAKEAFQRMCILSGWNKPNVIYGDMDTVMNALDKVNLKSQNMESFVKWIYHEIDCAAIQDKLEEFKLIRREDYSIDEHGKSVGDAYDIEEGDDIYFLDLYE